MYFDVKKSQLFDKNILNSIRNNYSKEKCNCLKNIVNFNVDFCPFFQRFARQCSPRVSLARQCSPRVSLACELCPRGPHARQCSSRGARALDRCPRGPPLPREERKYREWFIRTQEQRAGCLYASGTRAGCSYTR